MIDAPPGAALASVPELYRRHRFRDLPWVDPSGRTVGVARERDAYGLERDAGYAGRRT